MTRSADAPWGPWSAPITVFRCPDVRWDKRVFCYAAKAHPSESTADEILVSYISNSFDFWHVARDVRCTGRDLSGYDGRRLVPDYTVPSEGGLMSDQPVRRPWWQRFRFSLRGLMIAIGILGVGAGWLVHRAHVQRDAVAAIERAGGKVMYDWQWRNARKLPDGRIRWPNWLVDRIVVDFFADVTYVNLGLDGSDELLVQVGQLYRLEYLRLARAWRLSDAGLENLKGLTALQWLSLDETKIGDAGLAHLKNLKQLQTLLLGLTKVTDAGLSYLKPLTRLKVLSLYFTSVSDHGGQDLQRALPKTIIAGPGWAGRGQARALEINERLANGKAER